ncbi:unnamed protein product [Peniophora sp. CBMAI 1063]|nr:unnamed protein product [Peniophora sp. CBMAI 1063]
MPRHYGSVSRRLQVSGSALRGRVSSNANVHFTADEQAQQTAVVGGLAQYVSQYEDDSDEDISLARVIANNASQQGIQPIKALSPKSRARKSTEEERFDMAVYVFFATKNKEQDMNQPRSWLSFAQMKDYEHRNKNGWARIYKNFKTEIDNLVRKWRLLESLARGAKPGVEASTDESVEAE